MGWRQLDGASRAWLLRGRSHVAHDEVALRGRGRGRGSRAWRKDAVPREFQRSSRVHGYDLSVRTERCAAPKDDLNGRVQDDPGKLTRTTAVARVRGGASTPGGLRSEERRVGKERKAGE